MATERRTPTITHEEYIPWDLVDHQDWSPVEINGLADLRLTALRPVAYTPDEGAYLDGEGWCYGVSEVRYGPERLVIETKYTASDSRGDYEAWRRPDSESEWEQVAYALARHLATLHPKRQWPLDPNMV